MLAILCASRGGTEIPMITIEHETKGGSMADGRTFLGINKKNVCRWDMRTPQGAVQKLAVDFVHGFPYQGREELTCMKVRLLLVPVVQLQH